MTLCGWGRVAPATLAGLVLVVAVALGGCATVPAGGATPTATSRVDPWESWNRKVFAFNEAVDEAVRV